MPLQIRSIVPEGSTVIQLGYRASTLNNCQTMYQHKHVLHVSSSGDKLVQGSVVPIQLGFLTFAEGLMQAQTLPKHAPQQHCRC